MLEHNSNHIDPSLAPLKVYKREGWNDTTHAKYCDVLRDRSISAFHASLEEKERQESAAVQYNSEASCPVNRSTNIAPKATRCEKEQQQPRNTKLIYVNITTPAS